ncbi:MAG: hypothetical protein EOM67_16220 [Spirochaetia bacterium]|nr:hypothetical protein [Spirochaetia bacterium]
MNFNEQYYRGIPLKLIDRNYQGYNAKRYVINRTNQNVWIPNIYLLDDGTIRDNIDLDFIFRKASKQGKLKLAGVKDPYERVVKRRLFN